MLVIPSFSLGKPTECFKSKGSVDNWKFNWMPESIYDHQYIRIASSDGKVDKFR